MKPVLACLVFAIACGGKSSPPATSTTPTTSSSQPPATAALPDVPFDKLDQDQREQFMKQKVMPAMKVVFQKRDPQKFAKFTCETCHGEGAAQGHFDMPNPKLPKLVVKELMAGTSQYKKEDLEWMGKEVKPTMAKILQMPEWTPDNPKGFGCNGCHLMEE